MGRFLSPIDISAARFEQEILNSLIKRGEFDTTKITRSAHVVCGCGAPKCIFHTHWRKDPDVSPYTPKQKTL